MSKNKSFKKGYNYHLLRAVAAFVAITVLSWAIWKLLDTYLFPHATLPNALGAIIAAVIILLVDHFHLKELN